MKVMKPKPTGEMRCECEVCFLALTAQPESQTVEGDEDRAALAAMEPTKTWEYPLCLPSMYDVLNGDLQGCSNESREGCGQVSLLGFVSNGKPLTDSPSTPSHTPRHLPIVVTGQSACPWAWCGVEGSMDSPLGTFAIGNMQNITMRVLVLKERVQLAIRF